MEGLVVTTTRFDDAFAGRRVFVTGHTGFKGSWLTQWLLHLGAKVVGYSDCIPTQPSLFEALNLGPQIEHLTGDVRDAAALSEALRASEPDFVFHLAAQPIVSLSYDAPLLTLSTNVMGTANLLDALRKLRRPCAAIIVTSDKCYENHEWVWGYRESDVLGGHDIYSASKSAAENVFHAYVKSFFADAKGPVRLASARAGNVIGGGDWAQDRIVVDCIRSWSRDEPALIRRPGATRPWQHVLEPLSGYLTLAAQLNGNSSVHGESFNFGPRDEQPRRVIDLIQDLSVQWGFASFDRALRVAENVPFHEAGLLRLNCDKARSLLGWQATLDYSECVHLVGQWYRKWHEDKDDLKQLTVDQIERYEARALERKMTWLR